MSSLIENIPIAKIPDDDSNLISVYLTSIPSVDCVTFAFTCYRVCYLFGIEMNFNLYKTHHF